MKDRLRPLLERLEAGPSAPGAGEYREVLDALRAAAQEAEELASRENVYRETIRQGNREFGRKVLELSILRQIGDLIAGSLKVDDLLDRVLEILVKELRVDNSSVMLIDDDTGDLRVEAGHGGRSDNGSPVLRVGEGIAGCVAAAQESLIVNDVSRDVRFQHAGEGVRLRGSLVCVPLVAEDQVLGVLNLSTDAIGFFDSQHVHILRIVASQIAGALMGKELYRELRKLSDRLEEDVAQRTGQLRKRTTDLRRKNEQVTQLYFSLERAQKELEQRNRRLVEALTFNDNIVETINVGISVVSHEGRVVTWNRAMEGLTGGRLSKEMVLGRKLEELPGDALDDFALGHALGDALNGRTPIALHDHVVELPDRKRLHLNVHHLPVSIANDGHVQLITVVEDVTDNVSLHEQRVRSERLAAINETMVSVNHEVNNPLAVILGYAQILLRKRRQSGGEEEMRRWMEEARRDLQRIESEAMRIREITRKLSSLVDPVVTSYPAADGVRMVDVNQSR